MRSYNFKFILYLAILLSQFFTGFGIELSIHRHWSTTNNRISILRAKKRISSLEIKELQELRGVSNKSVIVTSSFRYINALFIALLLGHIIKMKNKDNIK